MNSNTKVRIRLSKQLFESLSKQIIAEAKKMDMSGGAYTEAVKAPKAPKAPKSPEVSKTNKMKTMGEGMEDKNFTYKDSSGKEKFVTANDIDQAKEKVQKFGGDINSVKEKSAALPIAPKKMEENKNPEMDKVVKNLVNRLTKHFGHNDHKSTIGALKAALARLEKSHDDKKEEEEEE